MGSIKDLMYEENEDQIENGEDIGALDVSYPKKLHVDGYDVNHYHDGDVPVYEILDDKGNIIDVAHSTNEMHEFTGSRNREDDE